MSGERRRAIGVCIVIYGAACALLGVTPVLAGIFADHFHLSLSEVAWLLSAEQTGGFVGSLVGYWLTSRTPWRRLIVAASLITAGANLLSGSMGGYSTLMLCRFVSGFGMVLTTMVAACVIARSEQTVRAFGAGLFLSVLSNVIQIWLTESTKARLGYSASLAAGAPFYILCAVAAFALPRTLGAEPQARQLIGATPELGKNRLGATGVVGLVLFGISVNAVWGFVERIGRFNGLSSDAIAAGLELGTLGGLLGGLVPTILGSRVGVARMIAINTALYLAGYALLCCSFNSLTYSGAICLLMSTWTMGLVYYMALVSRNDPSGRQTRLMNAGTVFAQALGPLLSGMVLAWGTLSKIGYLAAGPAILALALVVVVQHADRTRALIPEVNA